MTDPSPAFAEEIALERTGGDRKLLEELIGVFLTEIPNWMRELATALGRGDAVEVHRIAHTIKGAVDSCGASRAYDAAMVLERLGQRGDARRRDVGLRDARPRDRARAARAGRVRRRRRARKATAAPIRPAIGPRRAGLMPVVLVVDDSPLDRTRTGGLLKKGEGLSPIYASNGREALAMIAAEKPDIVLTDLQMPEMDGLELVETIRRDSPRPAGDPDDRPRQRGDRHPGPAQGGDQLRRQAEPGPRSSSPR